MKHGPGYQCLLYSNCFTESSGVSQGNTETWWRAVFVASIKYKASAGCLLSYCHGSVVICVYSRSHLSCCACIWYPTMLFVFFRFPVLCFICPRSSRWARAVLERVHMPWVHTVCVSGQPLCSHGSHVCSLYLNSFAPQSPAFHLYPVMLCCSMCTCICA